MITTQKYSGATVVFNKPHLIVFANWEPKYRMLSESMWDSRKIVLIDPDLDNSDYSHDNYKTINVNVHEAYQRKEAPKKNKQAFLDGDFDDYSDEDDNEAIYHTPKKPTKKKS